MTNSKQIAKLVGPILLAITLPEAINLKMWATQTAPVVYLNGAMLFAAGWAITRFHNVWTWRWPVVITLAGWFLVFAGLFRLFFSELALQETQNSAMVFIASATSALVGLFITFKAYSRGE